jgi:hypothetical protein
MPAAGTTMGTKTLVDLTQKLHAAQRDGEPQTAIINTLLNYVADYGFSVRHDYYDYKSLSAERKTDLAARLNSGLAKPAAKAAEAVETEDRDGIAFPVVSASAEAAPAPPPAENPAEAVRDHLSLSRDLFDYAPPVDTRKRGKRRGKKATLQVEIRRGLMYIKQPEGGRDPRVAAAPPASLGEYISGNNGKFVGRLLIYRESNRLPRRRPSLGELSMYNSFIFDAVTWDVLAVTPHGLSSNVRDADVNRELANDTYTIIRTNDGSLGTLYYWDHPAAGATWHMATARGYDVFAYKWTGERTWSELLHDLINRVHVLGDSLGAKLVRGLLGPDDVRLSFENLDPKRCYTVGMRHHDTHPITVDLEGLWCVQSVQLYCRRAADGWADVPQAETDGYKPSFVVGVEGIPNQTVLTRHAVAALLAEMRGERAPALGAAPPVTTEILRFLNANSLKRGCAAIANNDSKTIGECYGFLLRSCDLSKTHDMSNIIFDSELLSRVRYHIYRRASSEDTVRIADSPSSRNKYSIIRAYLTPGMADEILALFPHYKELVARVRTFVCNVSHFVVDSARAAATKSDAKRTSGKSLSATVTFGLAVLSQIRADHPAVNPFDAKTFPTIVEGYVAAPANALCIMRAIGEIV